MEAPMWYRKTVAALFFASCAAVIGATVWIVLTTLTFAAALLTLGLLGAVVSCIMAAPFID